MTQPLVPGTTTQNGLVANSDLMYDAPDNSPTFDLRAAEKSFIDQLLAGDEPTRMEEPDSADAWEREAGVIEDDEPEVSTESEPDADDSAPHLSDAETDEGADEEDDPKLARGIARVVQRELAAKEREAKAEAAEKALEAKLTELRSLQGLKPVHEIAELMDTDPLAAFKALGKTPGDVIRLALAQELGENAPDNLKEFAREASSKREIAKIRAELAAERQVRAAQEYFNTISSGAREYVTKMSGDIAFLKKAPTLAQAAKVDPQSVHDEIMEEIVKEARVRAAQDPNGEPISYEEAASRVEARFARMAKLISVPGTNPAAKIGTKPGKRVTPPSTKPAPKPLPPWKNKSSSLEEQGFQEALAEYERVEAERKARRLSR